MNPHLPLDIEHIQCDRAGDARRNQEFGGGDDDLAHWDQHPAATLAIPNSDVAASSGFGDWNIHIKCRNTKGFEVVCGTHVTFSTDYDGEQTTPLSGSVQLNSPPNCLLSTAFAHELCRAAALVPSGEPA